MATQQTGIRLLPVTRRQLAELTAAGYGTQSEIIRMAIDRLYVAAIASQPAAVSVAQDGEADQAE